MILLLLILERFIRNNLNDVIFGSYGELIVIEEERLVLIVENVSFGLIVDKSALVVNETLDG